jgi:hypothetical protein
MRFTAIAMRTLKSCDERLVRPTTTTCLPRFVQFKAPLRHLNGTTRGSEGVQDDGTPLTRQIVQTRVKAAAR